MFDPLLQVLPVPAGEPGAHAPCHVAGVAHGDEHVYLAPGRSLNVRGNYHRIPLPVYVLNRFQSRFITIASFHGIPKYTHLLIFFIFAMHGMFFSVSRGTRLLLWDPYYHSI